MMISNKNMEKYGLKTGPGLKDVLPYKEFNTEEIRDEILKIGFYSDFFNFKDELKLYPLDDILILADVDEVYGENWLIALDADARDRELKVITEKADAEAAAKRAQEEEEARKKAEEEAALNAVYEDKPIIAKPWASETADKSREEVDKLTVKQKRPLLCLGMVRKRREFGQIVRFTDRVETNMQECRQHKDPNYDLHKRELDIGLQAVPLQKDNGTQTTWFRSVNKTLQYEAIEMSPTEKAAQIEDPNLLAFLTQVQPLVEEALQQNETLDLFKDEFKDLGEEDLALGNKSENNIKELKTFTDLEYSKNKALPAVDWHPRKKGIVAVAAVNNLTFDQRVQIAGKVSTSYLLIWNFTDLIHPQLMLESPHDTYCFRFNPTHPNLIAAGCISGQVILWDCSDAMDQLQRKKGKTVASQEGEEERDKMLPPVRHLAVSHIDTSHKRPVADLIWLPAGMEVNYRGNVEKTDATVSYQFMTVAGDGQACIWDTRYKEIAKKNPRLHKDLKPNKDGTMPEAMWQPQYKLTLTKLEGVGELGLARLNLKCHIKKRQTEDGEEDDSFSTQFYCATEEGEMVFADWKPHAGGGHGGGHDDDDGGGDAPEYVQWMAQDHFRPCVALQRSPFFPDILLSVSDWSFNLWQEGMKTPLFSSPLGSAYFTTGRWSPTRPGVLMVAKADGSIDVWDFTDQSHRASNSFNIAPSAITSLEFWHNISNQKLQYLAVGDSNGNLHILDTPRNLWRPLNNEKEVMDSFFEREKLHVDYVRERMEVRESEKAAMEAEAEAQESEGGAPKKNAEELAKEEEKREEEYRAMEQAFRRELGLDGDEEDDEDA